MSKQELNKYAIALAKKVFQSHGFEIEDHKLDSKVDFRVVQRNDDKIMKIKVRAISQLGSYVFMPKRRFNIEDPDLYMVLFFIPRESDERIMYLIPATDWGKNIYPLTGKDYNKPGLVSEPEWGISFSCKAMAAMMPYLFWDIK